MNTTLKTIIKSAMSPIRDGLRSEKERLAIQRQAMAEREAEVKRLEEEHQALTQRRDMLLERQAGIAFTKQNQEANLAKLVAKNEAWIKTAHPPSSEGGTGFMRRAITKRRLEDDMRLFLQRDLPLAEKGIAAELAQAEAEIDAFERKLAAA